MRSHETSDRERSHNAILYKSGFWKQLTPSEIFIYQVTGKGLCVPLMVFHAAAEFALNRPVWMYELTNFEALEAEFTKSDTGISKSTFLYDLLAKIDKRVCLILDAETK